MALSLTFLLVRWRLYKGNVGRHRKWDLDKWVVLTNGAPSIVIHIVRRVMHAIGPSVLNVAFDPQDAGASQASPMPSFLYQC